MDERKPVRRLKTSKLLSQLIKNYYVGLAQAKEQGKPIAWLNGEAPVEICYAMDIFPAFPENYAAVCGSGQLSGNLCDVAENMGYSNELCSYARTITGMISGEVKGLPGGGLPEPDLLIADEIACTTHVKWWEALSRHFKRPLFTVDAAFGMDEEVTDYQEEYFVSELKGLVSFLEEHTKKKLDLDRLKEIVRLSDEAAALWVEILGLRKSIPTPIGPSDVYTNMFPAVTLTGTQPAVDFYRQLRDEVKELAERGIGVIPNEKYRVFYEFFPLWYDLGLMNYFEERGAVIVCDSYVSGFAGRIEATDPLYGLAQRYLGVQVVRSGVRKKLEMFDDLIEEYQVDGIMFHGNRCCRLLTIGQLDIINALKEKFNIPIGYFEGDMTDPRGYNREEVIGAIDVFLDLMESKKG